MSGGYSAISIRCHNIGFLSALEVTIVSFDAIILSCLGPFVSAFGQKLVLCLQRFLLVLT